MLVKTMYVPGVMAADGDETLEVAAARMQDHAVGSLTVYEDGKLMGIITEHDIVTAVAAGANTAEASVRAHMTEGVVTVTPETESAEAAAMMIMLGARHLPVVEDGRMVGMVSARDLLHALAAGPAG